MFGEIFDSAAGGIMKVRGSIRADSAEGKAVLGGEVCVKEWRRRNKRVGSFTTRVEV